MMMFQKLKYPRKLSQMKNVLRGGPWSFDKQLFILGVIKGGENPPNVPLFNVPYWIQIHGLPFGFMS
ncbi:hypothetical protein JHK85_043787 [Glycine max]|nr:hypothetical protein JHK85_043787 [Glycine max]